MAKLNPDTCVVVPQLSRRLRERIVMADSEMLVRILGTIEGKRRGDKAYVHFAEDQFPQVGDYTLVRRSVQEELKKRGLGAARKTDSRLSPVKVTG